MPPRPISRAPGWAAAGSRPGLSGACPAHVVAWSVQGRGWPGPLPAGLLSAGLAGSWLGAGRAAWLLFFLFFPSPTAPFWSPL